MKIDWILYRFEENNKGTLSQNLILSENGYYEFACYALELPMKSNIINISCIPKGFYKFEKRIHQKFGKIIEIQNVVGRTHILAHIGNFLKDTRGCILPCDNYITSELTHQYVGQRSQEAVERLYYNLPKVGYMHIV